MDNRTILILQGPKGTPQELSPLANAVAAVGGRLHVLQVDEMPAIPTYAIEGYPVPAGWDQTRRELADNLKTRGAETATYLANLGVATETDIIYETAVEMAHQIVPHALRADVAVITNDLRENKDVFQSLSHGILFESPIPLILNPTENAITPKRVTVAWSESLPTARAVHAALCVRAFNERASCPPHRARCKLPSCLLSELSVENKARAANKEFRPSCASWRVAPLTWSRPRWRLLRY